MSITEEEVKKASLILLILILAVLAFITVKPILMSVIAGLILAYIFFPIYKKVLERVKSRNLSASIVSVLVLLILFVPLWFLIPPIVQQVFWIFQATQTLDVNEIIRTVLPT